MSTVFGKGFAAIGALPNIGPGNNKPENLMAGMLIVVPALLVSGVVLLAGARHLQREMNLMIAKLKANPPASPQVIVPVQ